MAKKTAIESLDSAIDEILEDYADSIRTNIGEVVEKMGKAGKTELRTVSKSKFGGTGKYAKGWKSTVEKSNIGSTAVLHNTIPGLPHLLENGHAKRGGGRVPGVAHIAPVEKELVKKFEKAVEEAIQK